MDLAVKQDVAIPLLVQIQTVEVEHLDFRSSIAKNKHVTYIDGTSRFLIVGCTSGSVYVFSRESLKFLFIIPFKGGKVCGISCAEDETDVAIGSIRGKVAIYRLLNLESTKSLVSSEKSVSNPVPCTVKHLYAVSHHTNNEITEMLWSPNGRYLFIGDNQGLISQVDVGSLDEFPRPPPSRIILQLQSRVLQLDCIFPYLAVNTVSGVFLCDIENEDFTRIQNPQHRTSHLPSSGICLLHTPDASPDDSSSISLYVAGESATIYRYSMQGNLLEDCEIQENFPFQKEVNLFDPKKSPVLTDSQSPVSISDFKKSLGKLFTCDEGYIISATHDRMLIIDPSGMKIIFWNDNFRRISTVKVLSNYLFVWETGKFHVLALTSFRTYGEHLLKANLHAVLENWIQHALNVVGWRKELEEEATLQEDEQEFQHVQERIERSRKLIHSMIHPHSLSSSPDVDDLDEFAHFVISHVPKLIAENMHDSQDTQSLGLDEPGPTQEKVKFDNALTKLIKSFQQLTAPSAHQQINNDCISSEVDNSSNLENNVCVSYTVLKNLIEFYNEIEAKLPQDVGCNDEDSVIYKQSLFQNKMTLDSLIQSGLWFWQQDRLKLIEIEYQSSVEFVQLEEHLPLIIPLVSDCFIEEEIFLQLEEQVSYVPSLVTKFTSQHLVTKWFTDFNNSMLNVKNDAFLADLFFLLIPLIQWTKSHDLKELLKDHSQRFFTWLVILVSCRESRTFPYEQQLSNFLVEKIQPNNINEVISCVYEDLEQVKSADEPSTVKYLHHFATLLYFKAMTKNARNKILSSLITNFPLKGRMKDEIKEKVLLLCRENASLVAMYKEACMTDGNSQELCQCGIPSSFGIPSFFMIPKTQRLIEEVILEILLLQNSVDDAQPKVIVKSKCEAFSFAMQRLLFDNYFQLLCSDSASTRTNKKQPTIDDRLKLNIIFRTGQCHLLQTYFPFSWSRLELVIELYEKLYLDSRVKELCHGCQTVIKILPNYKIMSWDCVGLWILGDSSLNETERLTKVLQRTNSLNRPGIFSLRFYQLLAKSGNGDRQFEEEEEDYDLTLLRRTAGINNINIKNRSLCAALH